MNNIKKTTNPLSGLAGMSDGKDAERYQAQQLGAGDTLKNSASKGVLRSGSELAELMGDGNE